MKPEYDLDKMKSRPNPFAKQLKQQVTLPLGIDVIEYFEAMAQDNEKSHFYKGFALSLHQWAMFATRVCGSREMKLAVKCKYKYRFDKLR
ncbi:MAG: hypothetical protein ACSI46_20460 [Gloeotrichia echinulata DVL01]|jgi:hypothetical protein